MAEKKKHNLTIYGLSVWDADGNVVQTEDGTAHTYFRNMMLEFIGRHYPDTLLSYFPNIWGPWNWGKCRDLAEFKKFCAEHFELRLNDDGTASVLTLKQIEEVIYQPNKFKRKSAGSIEAETDMDDESS